MARGDRGVQGPTVAAYPFLGRRSGDHVELTNTVLPPPADADGFVELPARSRLAVGDRLRRREGHSDTQLYSDDRRVGHPRYDMTFDGTSGRSSGRGGEVGPAMTSRWPSGSSSRAPASDRSRWHDHRPGQIGTPTASRSPSVRRTCVHGMTLVCMSQRLPAADPERSTSPTAGSHDTPAELPTPGSERAVDRSTSGMGFVATSAEARADRWRRTRNAAVGRPASATAASRPMS